jgi:hypothetical protein
VPALTTGGAGADSEAESSDYDTEDE